MGKDYYATLGVSKDADEAAIKKAYKKSALKARLISTRIIVCAVLEGKDPAWSCLGPWRL